MIKEIIKEDGTKITLDVNEEGRTCCEVWTRIMGYHRPVANFNAGKQSEHKKRKFFKST